MSDFKWKKNLCCIATYKTLEGDDALDEFEEEDISFVKAKSVKMGSLRYFPKTTSNRELIELLSYEIARKYLKLIVKKYSVSKANKQITSATIIRRLASVFGDKNATIKNLAEVTDSAIKFS